MASLEERARAAHDDLKAALNSLYPRLFHIVIVALIITLVCCASQSNAYASIQLKLSHLAVLFESISSRRVIPGFAATLPPPP